MVRVFRWGLPFLIGRKMQVTTLNRASGGDFAYSLTRSRVQVEDRTANGSYCTFMELYCCTAVRPRPALWADGAQWEKPSFDPLVWSDIHPRV